MAGSRQFGTGDSLTLSLGQANVTAAFSMLVVLRPTNPGSGTPNILAAGSNNCNMFVSDPAGDRVAWWNGGSQRDTASVVSLNDEWQVWVINKAAGTATPRLHIYRYATASWARGDGGSTSGDVTAGTSWIVGGGLAAYVCCAAIVKASLSDATIDGLTSYAAILASFAVSTGEVWRLDGTSNFNGTGTSTQSAISGTSRSTDSPDGFWGTPNLVLPVGTS